MVLTKVTAVEYVRNSNATYKLCPSGERTSISEFPKTPTTCHGTPSGCVSEFLYTPKLEHPPTAKRYEEPFTICSPTINQKPWLSVAQCIANEEMSFEVRVQNVKETVPGWDDDDVDEFIVLSPKYKHRMLSVIVESPTKHKRISASDFEVIRPLQEVGVTEFGELVLGRKKDTACLHTIKMFRKSTVDTNRDGYAHMRAEQAALRLVTERRIPFTTRLQWSFQDEKALYVVMGGRTGMNLRTCIERDGALPPKNATVYSAQLVEALMALHAAGIVHRDLKPETTSITQDGQIIVSEFGRADVAQRRESRYGLNSSSAFAAPAAAAYQAPEILLGWAHDHTVDWWGFALVLCFMLTGSHALLGEDDSTPTHPSILQSRILHGQLSAYVSDRLEPNALDLISKSLQRNPALRLAGDNVKHHAFFSGVDWTRVRESRVPVPVSDVFGEAVNLDQSFEEESAQPEIKGMLASAVLPDAGMGPRVVDGFSFTWELDDADSCDMQALTSAHGGNLPTTVDTGTPLLETNSPPTQDTPDMAIDAREDEASIPAEFSSCQADLPSPRKFGTLRKYSSLNFDLDTLESVPSSGRMNPLGASPPFESPAHQLRKSQSIYTTSPFTQSSSGTRNKLRKKSRPDSTPIPTYVQHPILDLPPGVEQIGNGIGYTRRTDPVSARLSFSTLTPRSCHGIFSGGRFSAMTSGHGRKKAGSGGGPVGGVSVMSGANDSEDQMDAVMQELYGSRWNVDASASEMSHAGGADPRVYTGLTRTSVGLGLGDASLELARARLPTPSAELSTLSPDSTLRLVSPSMHGLGYT